jgi:hypothetical protein
MKSLLIVGFGFVLSASMAFGQADDLTSITVEGRSAKPYASEASREIGAWAQTTVAREQAIELLGDTSYQKHKVDVENKIVKQASKFMPFINPGDTTQLPDRTFKMPVTLKVSMPSLRRLMLESGLMNEAGSPLSMIPVVSFIDRRKGQSVRWWLGETADPNARDVVDTNREVLRAMNVAFAKKGFWLAKPSEGTEATAPEQARTEKPQGDALVALAKQFSAVLAVRGDVRISDTREDGEGVTGSIKLEVVHPASGRVVADVSKSFSTMTAGKEMKTALLKSVVDASEDLARQVSDTWQRGTLNANSLRLAVRGDLNPKQLNAFKTALTTKVREVRNLRDRVFERGMVVMDVDFSGSPAPFASRLKALSLPGFTVRAAESSNDTVILDVQAQ